jgi:hypothetical protein
MRVWLIEDERCETTQTSLEPLLRALGQQTGTGVALAGVSGLRDDLPDLARANLLQALVLNTLGWPQLPEPARLTALGLPVLVVGQLALLEAWRTAAEQQPIAFLPTSASHAELGAALWTLLAAHRRECSLKGELDRFQQRLNDRILIEKAKGVLMTRLGVGEEDAYKRLRMQSRRQRKQIREIAQSILDTQFLLEPNVTVNGAAKKQRLRKRGPVPVLAGGRDGEPARAAGASSGNGSNEVAVHAGERQNGATLPPD